MCPVNFYITLCVNSRDSDNPVISSALPQDALLRKISENELFAVGSP